MIDDFLAGIPEADDFIIRLQNIIGGKYKDGILKLDFSLDMDTPEEIRKARAKMILIRQELKSLRGEVVRAVYRINAEFLRLKGHYPGASEAIKADWRQQQLLARANYETLKAGIDGCRAQIEACLTEEGLI